MIQVQVRFSAGLRAPSRSSVHVHVPAHVLSRAYSARVGVFDLLSRPFTGRVCAQSRSISSRVTLLNTASSWASSSSTGVRKGGEPSALGCLSFSGKTNATANIPLRLAGIRQLSSINCLSTVRDTDPKAKWVNRVRCLSTTVRATDPKANALKPNHDVNSFEFNPNDPEFDFNPEDLPVTEAELAELDFEMLELAVQDCARPYTFGGSLGVGEGGGAKFGLEGEVCRATLPLDTTTARSIYDAATPSETQPRELSPEQITLDFGVSASAPASKQTGTLSTLPPSILAAVEHRLGYSPGGLSAEFDRVVVYDGAGGGATVDPPQNEHHIGTLTLSLSGSGLYEVDHAGEKQAYDWPQATVQQEEISWAFQYSDCAYSVRNVEGILVLATYQVFETPSTPASTLAQPRKSTAQSSTSSQESRPHAREHLAETKDYASANLSALFESMLRDETFMPDGGVLGFGLQYHYPVDKFGWPDERSNGSQDNLGQDRHELINQHLKGEDASLQLALDTAGLSYQFGAVYDVKPPPGFQHGTNVDNTSTTGFKDRTYLAVSRFDMLQGQYVPAHYEVLYDHRMYPRDKVTWITAPGAWSRNVFMADRGNIPHTAYVSVGILARVGSAAERGAGPVSLREDDQGMAL